MSTHAADDPVRVAGATLASLPGAVPARLRHLFAHFGSATAALDAVLRGDARDALPADDERADELTRRGRHVADPAAIARTLRARNTHVWVKDTPEWPFTRPVDDEPCVLFGEGDDVDVFERPRVAMVGTRAASPHGLADAHELGEFLARCGITVVSGLAIGIDAASHEGVLDAGGMAVGVVATGLDVEYPRRHDALYRRVREHGVVVGEYWYGTPPRKSQFPVRNRIIAALADVVLVVEATRSGGTLHTVRSAAEYGRAVVAVPGTRRNPAARGCLRLIRDGALCLDDPSDVLGALELTYGGKVEGRPPPKLPPSPNAHTVMRALSGEPATIDELVMRTKLSLGDVVRTVRDLERGNAVTRKRGYVWPC
jgi:DNA processing protein